MKHSDNHKWFDLVMEVKAENLGLDGKELLDVMDIKLDPENIELLQDESEFLPAYHMNKGHWLSIEISKVDSKQICNLLDNSYELTK